MKIVNDKISIRKIEIEFPREISIDPRVFRAIDVIITKYVCEPYKVEHPNRTMWVSGHGSKPNFSRIDAMFLGKTEYDHTVPDGAEPRYEDDIYQIEISERENYER